MSSEIEGQDLQDISISRSVMTECVDSINVLLFVITTKNICHVILALIT